MSYLNPCSQIAVMLCCCPPCGVGAVVYDMQANTMVSAGDLDKAWANHKAAAQCRIASLVVGIITIITIIVVHNAMSLDQ